MLALNGGPKTREKPWPSYPIIGDAERGAVNRVLDRGLLQGFRGSEGPYFYGGPEVQAFEQQFADYHGKQFAVMMSSASACLHAAMKCYDVGVDDIVVVTPFSFNTSSTSPLYVDAFPVFADIGEHDFCINATTISEALKKRDIRLVKAVIVVDLFGQIANLPPIVEMCRRHGWALIEDAAQAPGATLNGQLAGTFGDCGIFSFVGEKNASCGEGGMLITNDAKVARIARLFRNHADALYEPWLGYNYRPTEIAAAIAAEQWKQVDARNERRRELVDYLEAGIQSRGLDEFITIPMTRGESAFYVTPFLYHCEEVPRDYFVRAMCAEGIPMGAGYIRPLNLLPVMYHYGVHDSCPVAERMWREKLVITGIVRPPASELCMEDILVAMEKVFHDYPY